MNETESVKAAIRSGCIAELGRCAEQFSDFPSGRSSAFPHKRWVEFIVIHGALPAVLWLIKNYSDEIKRYSVDSRSIDLPLVHAALARDDMHKYDVLKLLLDAGADPDSRWLNDYTAGHVAAIANDCVALELLDKAGADFSLRTRIDDQLTARQEALLLLEAENDATRYLELWERKHAFNRIHLEGGVEDPEEG